MTELYEGTVVEVARRLVGSQLTSLLGGVRTAVRLTEVEAYGGTEDPASHAYRGETARNRSMFREAGTLYVYRSYGVHWCANVVTGPSGVGEAVLLRAAEPLEGIEEIRRRRGREDHLLDGPGKLCQALGITGAQDGTSLSSGPVRLEPPEKPVNVEATRRVGITKGTELPWRFVEVP